MTTDSSVVTMDSQTLEDYKSAIDTFKKTAGDFESTIEGIIQKIQEKYQGAGADNCVAAWTKFKESISTLVSNLEGTSTSVETDKGAFEKALREIDDTF